MDKPIPPKGKVESGLSRSDKELLISVCGGIVMGALVIALALITAYIVEPNPKHDTGVSDNTTQTPCGARQTIPEKK